MPMKMRLFYLAKNTISRIQSHHSPRVRKTIKRSNAIIAATQTAYDTMVNYHHHPNVTFINETGIDISKTCSVKHEYNHKRLELLWVGRFLITKRLDIALESIAACQEQNIHLTIAGTGNEAEVQHYHQMATQLGIDDKVTWIGNVPNIKIQDLMKTSDAFFFTSVLEATSTVVPEAISNNLPIICFNTCGFGHLVKDKVGITIELQSPKCASHAFAKIIDTVAKNKHLLQDYSQACDKYKQELSWQWKAKKVLELYNHVIETN